jgi:hypothetical protein
MPSVLIFRGRLGAEEAGPLRLSSAPRGQGLYPCGYLFTPYLTPSYVVGLRSATPTPPRSARVQGAQTAPLPRDIRTRATGTLARTARTLFAAARPAADSRPSTAPSGGEALPGSRRATCGPRTSTSGRLASQSRSSTRTHPRCGDARQMGRTHDESGLPEHLQLHQRTDREVFARSRRTGAAIPLVSGAACGTRAPLAPPPQAPPSIFAAASTRQRTA